MRKKKHFLKGYGIVKGVAEGYALVSKQNLSLWGGLDPQTGLIVDKRHELYGENVRGKVLVFPYGKGSTTGAIVLLEAVRCGNAPVSIINIKTEPILASGAIMAQIFYKKEIPIVDRLESNPVNVIHIGDYLKVDGNVGAIEIICTYTLK